MMSVDRFIDSVVDGSIDAEDAADALMEAPEKENLNDKITRISRELLTDPSGKPHKMQVHYARGSLFKAGRAYTGLSSPANYYNAHYVSEYGDEGPEIVVHIKSIGQSASDPTGHTVPIHNAYEGHIGINRKRRPNLIPHSEHEKYDEKIRFKVSDKEGSEKFFPHINKIISKLGLPMFPSSKGPTGLVKSTGKFDPAFSAQAIADRALLQRVKSEETMPSIKEMIEAAAKGTHPSQIVDKYLKEEIGPDRQDDIQTPADKDAAFRAQFARISSAYPYVDESWATRIADQIKYGEGIAELSQMAALNREQYAGTARIDVGGSFDTWDAIHRSLVATATNQLPPPPPPLQ